MSELGTIAALICLTIFAIVVLYGIFKTRKVGFGKYTTSLLLLVIILSLSTFLVIIGLIDSNSYIHVLFAVTGFSGGLIGANKTGSE